MSILAAWCDVRLEVNWPFLFAVFDTLVLLLFLDNARLLPFVLTDATAMHGLLSLHHRFERNVEVTRQVKKANCKLGRYLFMHLLHVKCIQVNCKVFLELV